MIELGLNTYIDTHVFELDFEQHLETHSSCCII